MRRENVSDLLARRATIALITLILATYAAQFGAELLDELQSFGFVQATAMAFEGAPEHFIESGAVTPMLLNGEWWRAVTAIFLHAGLLHLLFNSWALLQFGWLLERIRGTWAMLTTFFASGICASITSALHLEGLHRSVGASGAIFGVVGALIAISGAGTKRSVQIQLATFAAISIAGGFLTEDIDNAAHAGGLAAGLVIGYVLRQSSRKSSSSARPTGNR